MKNWLKRAILLSILSGVVACGGGGGGSSTPPGGQNSAPTANAGADQAVTTGATVSLNAGASTDANGDSLTYLWSLTSTPNGSAATLSDANISTPTFVADVDGTYTAQLFVNDGTVNSVADRVTITSTTPNVAPVANAGIDQNVETGTMVALNGTASSDGNGDTLTYLWVLTRPAGSSATLSGATIASPTFTADVDGSYSAQLTVNDGTVDSTSDSVSIVASDSNAAPVANAGPDQNVNTGSLVTFDGTASSDAEGDNLSFSWVLTVKPAGSTAALSSTTLASPTITADVDGVYTAELTVNDGIENSAVDSVTITAATANSAPVANAGIDKNEKIDTLISLDGTASSDANGDLITYQWSFLSTPTGNTALLLNDDTAIPNFTPNVEGTYTVQLIVNDGVVASAPDTVNINVSVVNSAPVANAGEDQYVNTAVAVTLDGSASTDANNDTLTYVWNFTSRPTGSAASLTNSTAVNPSFTTDIEGSYIISLVVSDGTASSATDNVQVLVNDTTVRFEQKVGIFGNTFNDISFPYEKTLTVNFDISGTTTVNIDTFRITALGGDLTIENVQVSNETNSLVPYFTGVTEGLVLADGVTLEFSTVSPLTNDELIELHYSFDIVETGERFEAIFNLKTN